MPGTSPRGDACRVVVESVLRIRPMLKKERDDDVVLELAKPTSRNAPPTVTLHPLHKAITSPTMSGGRRRADSDATAATVPLDFHFHHVLTADTTQEKLYYDVGLPVVTQSIASMKKHGTSMAPSAHLIVGMGVANSGKTYTTIGASQVSNRRSADDGLVPRLADSLFSQSKHHMGSSGKFYVKVSVVQVTLDKAGDPRSSKVQDLLATPTQAPQENTISAPSPKKSVLSMAAKFERVVKPSPVKKLSAAPVPTLVELNIDNLRPKTKKARDETHLREILQSAFAASKKSSKGHVNHHIFITMQPVLNGDQVGDSISILDMAGLEKGKRNNRQRGKETVVNDNQAATAAVLHCLRTLIHNTNLKVGNLGAMDIECPDDVASEISCVSQPKAPIEKRLKPVPFRQHNVTMLLKPMFVACKTVRVTILLAAYPGQSDYYEKRTLLQDLELLCGSMLQSTNAVVHTGIPKEGRPYDNDMESESCADQSEFSSTFGGENSLMPLPNDYKAKSLLQSAKGRSLRRTSGSLGNGWRSTSSITVSDSSGDDASASVSMPPAYAPSYRGHGGRRVKPSAPSGASEVVPPPITSPVMLQPPQHTSYVSDFPGVVLPSGHHKNRLSIEPSSVVGGPSAKVPPFSPPTEDGGRDLYPTREREGAEHYEESEPVIHNTQKDREPRSEEYGHEENGIVSSHPRTEKKLPAMSPKRETRKHREEKVRVPDASRKNGREEHKQENNIRRAEVEGLRRDKRVERSQNTGGERTVKIHRVKALATPNIKPPQNRVRESISPELRSPLGESSIGNARDYGFESDRRNDQSNTKPFQKNRKTESRNKRNKNEDSENLLCQDENREAMNVHGQYKVYSKARSEGSHETGGDEPAHYGTDVFAPQSSSAEDSDYDVVEDWNDGNVQNSYPSNRESKTSHKQSRNVHVNRADHELRTGPSGSEKRMDINELVSQVHDLEARVREVAEQKEMLENKCKQLTFENKQLKSIIKTCSHVVPTKILSDQEDLEVLKHSRRHRLAEQKLLPDHVVDHMKKAGTTYDMQNQCFHTSKTHFGLRFPPYFRTASFLNERDRKEKEALSKSGPTGGETTTPSKKKNSIFSPGSLRKKNKGAGRFAQLKQWSTQAEKRKRTSLAAYQK